MAIVNFLQRHLKALTRVLVESSLDIKEIGVCEDAVQPEAVYKRSDSSGYIHFAAIEWLQSFVDNKGGARLIGVEDDSFNIITGDQSLQAVIKDIDNKIGQLATIGTFQITLDAATMGTVVIDCSYRLFDDYVDITWEETQWTIPIGSPAPPITGVPDAAFVSAGLIPPTSKVRLIPCVMNSSAGGQKEAAYVEVDRDGGTGRFTWYISDFTINPLETITLKQQTIRYKIADV